MQPLDSNFIGLVMLYRLSLAGIKLMWLFDSLML